MAAVQANPHLAIAACAARPHVRAVSFVDGAPLAQDFSLGRGAVAAELVVHLALPVRHARRSDFEEGHAADDPPHAAHRKAFAHVGLEVCSAGHRGGHLAVILEAVEHLCERLGLPDVESVGVAAGVVDRRGERDRRVGGGAVQLGGTACNNGEKNDENRKRIPQTTAVRPVLPPSITPAQDSFAIITEEVPVFFW